MTVHVQRSSRPTALSASAFTALEEAALDPQPIHGWTHNFYRYPARFSPRFAGTAIELFSNPGDLIVDPYMGGGTAVVEGVAAGRQVVGNDLNSLAAFIAKAKVTGLTPVEVAAIVRWSKDVIPELSYRLPSDEVRPLIDLQKTKNLSLVRARFIKKAVAAALGSLESVPTENAKVFLRCVLLRVSQWALDGRRQHTPLRDFRSKLSSTANEMLESLRLFSEQAKQSGGSATILNIDAASLDAAPVFREHAEGAALVVTSPPYPGVHVLYHRWQVDGRRETPAPYWITGCTDGKGPAYYNFGDRREAAAHKYFQTSLVTLQAIHRILRIGGYVVQMVAFNRPTQQLPRYLENMHAVGFAEVSVRGAKRIWRRVPHRRWHAALNGHTESANEVVLVHRAV